MYELFRAEVAKQKKLKRLTDADVARMSGLTIASVRAFMCGARESDRTANAIALALGIER